MIIIIMELVLPIQNVEVEMKGTLRHGKRKEYRGNQRNGVE